MSGKEPIEPVERGGAGAAGAPGRCARTSSLDDRGGEIRQEVVSRLRHEVATGAYRPSVDQLVDSLVGLLLTSRGGPPPEAGR